MRIRTSASAWVRGVADMFSAEGLDIGSLFRDAGLDPGALGKILPAHDLVETFREVNGATRAGLWEVAHRCEDLSDGVRELRNLYRKVDEAIADRFDSLAGDA